MFIITHAMASRTIAVFALFALAGCTGATRPMPDIRRIVTVANSTGEVVVLADDAGSNIIELNGSRIVRLWETTHMPVPLAVERDVGATAGNAYREGFIGSSFYVAEIPPGSDLSNIPLHQQDSLDYIAVLEGEIVLVLPEQQLRMQKGDLLVQAGNRHSWINDTEQTCRILVVVLTGHRGTNE